MNTYPKERRFERITLDVDSAQADDPDFFQFVRMCEDMKVWSVGRESEYTGPSTKRTV